MRAQQTPTYLRKPSRLPRKSAAASVAEPVATGVHRGRLIVVTCADPGRLNMLLHAARRHLGNAQRLAFCEPVSTFPLPGSVGTIVKPSEFAHLEHSSALLMVWRDGPRSYGYLDSIRNRLAVGENIVIGAPAHVEHQIRALWPGISILRLAAGTEPLRRQLSPQATFARAAVRATIQGEPSAPIDPVHFDARIEDSHDIAVAIRRLAAAIFSQIPQPVHPLAQSELTATTPTARKHRKQAPRLGPVQIEQTLPPVQPHELGRELRPLA